MNALRWKCLLIALVLLTGSGLARWAKPTRLLANDLPKVQLEQVFPEQVGDWSVDRSQPALIVSPDVEAMLAKLYAQTLSRVYVNPKGQRIMLSVAYGGDQSDATRAHRPDVCYPAQGFQVKSSGRQRVPLASGSELQVGTMTAVLGSRVEPVTYWFAVGGSLAISGQEQKLAQLRYGLRGFIPDGMLVRVSSIDRDEAAAYALQAEFLQQMHRSMASAWTPRVFGSQASLPAAAAQAAALSLP
jgi:EpsI family protein